jgi:alpha-beta hydrolase superfamily lysophospholipase
MMSGNNVHDKAASRTTRRVLVASLNCLLGIGLSACAGKHLQDWHTEKLDSEFTANDADTIVTFADYLALEDELFGALVDKIYIPIDTKNQLIRYSAGSMSDPMVREPNWNRSYEMPVADPAGGALLLHGMSDSPYSLRQMALDLRDRGYYVVGLRMPGHGTAPSGIVHVDWRDMAAAVRLGMDHLAQQVGDKPVHIVGYSTGATLALDFALDALAGAASPAPSSLVLISPAVGITAAAGMAGFINGLSKIGFRGLAYTTVEPEFDPYKYNSFSSNAGQQVHRLTKRVSRRMAELAKSYPSGDRRLPPVLVLQSTVDATVSSGALVDLMLLKLDPGRHELILFDINRFGPNYVLLNTDPAPVTDRLIANERLPFAVTLVGNASETSREVVAYRKLAFEDRVDSREPLDLAWPQEVISLSHVALPISPDDPLYGSVRPEDIGELYLGGVRVKGEKGLLRIPPGWLVRLRYNPFYAYLSARSLDWIDTANASTLTAPGQTGVGSNTHDSALQER